MRYNLRFAVMLFRSSFESHKEYKGQSNRVASPTTLQIRDLLSSVCVSVCLCVCVCARHESQVQLR